MKRLSSSIFNARKSLITIILLLVILLCYTQWSAGRSYTLTNKIAWFSLNISTNTNKSKTFLYHHSTCSCTRSYIEQKSISSTQNEKSQSLCSEYSTRRGLHQRIISISMYGPKENALFSFNRSLNFLHQLVMDMKIIYPSWILRVYHDTSINNDIICPIECIHNHVDFCNTTALGNLGNVGDYIPPKIWRFLPAADTFVDIMGSRDLDSPLIQRELDAVNEWISSNKVWHAMRDHPYHVVPMLGGMWGFRPELDRTFSNVLLRKILDRSLITRYGARHDQTFLSDQIWPHIQNSVIAHDSFLCTTSYGKNSRPWPTRRPPFNGSDCFVGCVRPCCELSKSPFGECPIACRPKEHPNWIYC